MITRAEPVMILLLKGLAKATCAAAKNMRATKYRTAGIFIVQHVYTICISQLESLPVAVQKRVGKQRTDRAKTFWDTKYIG
ncbi:MAG: hypothetical protein DME59_15675 [Verrucomicrobia bacterium]|nr:MAG: hypothetical protein DME59_15675 [Verrucomicrobiota bacterium]PYL71241.1 MAG: hypothetical protein DMF26_19750 [Verrucomicrobiota bacterium]